MLNLSKVRSLHRKAPPTTRAEGHPSNAHRVKRCPAEPLIRGHRVIAPPAKIENDRPRHHRDVFPIARIRGSLFEGIRDSGRNRKTIRRTTGKRDRVDDRSVKPKPE